MLQIRDFEMRDLERLYKLDQSCFSPAIAYSMAELLHLVARPSCFCWLAEDEGHFAGFIIMERIRTVNTREGHVVTIDVATPMRRRGVGNLLLKTAEVTLKEEGIGCLRLEVAVTNGGALEFYRQMGFQCTGTIREYYPDMTDAYVLRKTI